MADFDADAVRKQMAREGCSCKAPQTHCPDMSIECDYSQEAANLMLPLAVRAVTDAVRDLAREGDVVDFSHNGHAPIEGGPECPGCWAADIRDLCDEIDKAAGVDRG